MYAYAANAYRRVHLESASPARLLDELFVRLLADLDEARRAIGAGDVAAKGVAVTHGLAILAELRAALDPEAAPELCQNLGRLYDFATERLTEANVRIQASPLIEARRVLAVLRDAFGQAAGAAR